MAQQQGEQSAGRAIDAFRRHRREVERFFEARLPDRYASEDLCHEVFMRFLLADAAGVRPARPEAWLLRVARNLLIDTYRRSGVSGARELTLSDEAGPRLPDSRAVVDHLEQGELAASIAGAFRALRPKARRMLYWQEVERVPIRTIACRLGTSQGVVATELSRVRKQFRSNYARLHCAGLLEPDEEIFDEIGMLRSFDPLGVPEDQLAAIDARVLTYFEAMAPDGTPSWPARTRRCTRPESPMPCRSPATLASSTWGPAPATSRSTWRRTSARWSRWTARTPCSGRPPRSCLTRVRSTCSCARRRPRTCHLEAAGFETVLLQDSGHWEGSPGLPAPFPAFLLVGRARRSGPTRPLEPFERRRTDDWE